MAFNAPQKGDRIELKNRPGEYFLVTEKPESSKDARGQEFWSTRVMDPGGQEQFLSSDSVPSWSHFKGPNYGWHDQRIAEDRLRKIQKEQANLISEFEAANVFPDGRPLRTVPGRPLVVRVSESATGTLELFRGEAMRVGDIDYVAGTASLEPMDPDLLADPELASLARSVPASEVVANSAPAMRGNVGQEKVKVPVKDRQGLETGEFTEVTSEDFLNLTPELNRLAARGQVSLNANVYMNYENSGGENGKDVFARMLEGRGASLEGVDYYENFTERKERNGEWSPRYAWTGTVVVSPPVSEEAKAEIERNFTRSRFKELQNGGIYIYSNSLYRNMVSLGVFDESPKGAVAGWARSNCGFLRKS